MAQDDPDISQMAEAFLDAWESELGKVLSAQARPGDALRLWADLIDAAMPVDTEPSRVRDGGHATATGKRASDAAAGAETLGLALGQCLERLERLSDRLEAVERRLAAVESATNTDGKSSGAG